MMAEDATLTQIDIEQIKAEARKEARRQHEKELEAIEREAYNKARLEHHEDKCDMRYEEIFRRLGRIEKIIWSFICATMSAFGVMIYHVITKIPGY